MPVLDLKRVLEPDERPLPPHLVGVKVYITSSDIARALGTSQRWVYELMDRGDLQPSGVVMRWRRGRWEHFHLFDQAECDRIVRVRHEASRAPRRGPQPQQLPLMLELPGGRL